VSSLERLVLIHTLGVLLLGVALAFGNPAYFAAHYVNEDGVLEWLTVLALTTIAGTLCWRLWARRGTRTRRQTATLVVLAGLAVLGAGEEISWGQRLLALETPAGLAALNRQGETNLHNLVLGGVNLNKALFARGILLVFLLYLGVLTPLWHRVPRARAVIEAWGVPIPRRYQWVAYLVIITLVEGVVGQLAPSPARRGELAEFAVPMIVALNILCPRNRAPTGPAPPDRPAARPESP